MTAFPEDIEVQAAGQRLQAFHVRVIPEKCFQLVRVRGNQVYLSKYILQLC